MSITNGVTASANEDSTTHVNQDSGEFIVIPSDKRKNIGLILGSVIFIIIAIVAALAIAITVYKLKVQRRRKSERSFSRGKTVFQAIARYTLALIYS